MDHVRRLTSLQPQALTEPFNAKVHAKCASYNNLSPLAGFVARTVKSHIEESTGYREALETLTDPLAWEGAGTEDVSSDVLASATRSALQDIISDRTGECRLVGLEATEAILALPEDRGELDTADPPACRYRCPYLGSCPARGTHGTPVSGTP